MKDLTDKAAAMMNVILLGSVLLAWACFGAWHDPVQIGIRLYSTVSNFPEDQRSESMKAFLKEVPAPSQDQLPDYVRRAHVLMALAMRGDEVRVLVAPETLGKLNTESEFVRFRI